MEENDIMDGKLRSLCEKASELYGQPQHEEEWKDTVRLIKKVAEHYNVWAGKVRIREQILAGKDPFAEANIHLRQQGIDPDNFDKAAAKIMSSAKKRT